LLGGATEVELDKQGRFVMPQNLVTYASLKSEVIFLGLGRWVEIWDSSKWQKRKEYLSQNSSEIAEKLASVNL